MASLYQSANEERLRQQAMQQIARESGQDLQRIRLIYENELSRLQFGAQVRDYLVLLTARRAREALAARESTASSASLH